MKKIIQSVKDSSYLLSTLQPEDKNEAILMFSELILKYKDKLLLANKCDLDKNQSLNPQLKARLRLDEKKILHLSEAVKQIASLPELIGKETLHRQLDENLILKRIVVPLGVIGVIFESRPDVIPQILTLCLKTGNACVLKGGSEALETNKCFMGLVSELNQCFSFFPKHWSLLLEDRESVADLLRMEGLVDLIVPRGSKELVKYIQSHTNIPVLGHAEGVCHLYVHESADLDMAVKLLIDGKTQYPTACNSIETLLVDNKCSKEFLKIASVELKNAGVEIFACNESRRYIEANPATEVNWKTEYSDLKLSIKTVKDISEAIQHINMYGSHHTDVICANNEFIQSVFLNGVDSAGVYVNASSRFADGFRYGFGAEVGISTNKIHARGPVGIDGLVTYKYTLVGKGQIVKDYSEGHRSFKHKDI